MLHLPINALEAEVRALSDEAIKERYAELRKQVQDLLKDADPEDKYYEPSAQTPAWLSHSV